MLDVRSDSIDKVGISTRPKMQLNTKVANKPKQIIARLPSIKIPPLTCAVQLLIDYKDFTLYNYQEQPKLTTKGAVF